MGNRRRVADCNRCLKTITVATAYTMQVEGECAEDRINEKDGFLGLSPIEGAITPKSVGNFGDFCQECWPIVSLALSKVIMQGRPKTKT